MPNYVELSTGMESFQYPNKRLHFSNAPDVACRTYDRVTLVRNNGLVRVDFSVVELAFLSLVEEK